MVSDQEKIEKAIVVLQKIAKGVNPLTGESLNDESFLNDPRIIRMFFFVAEVLQKVRNGTLSNRNKPTKFFITTEQKQKVRFPAYKIGVNEFSKCVNECIDLNESKRLTGTELNKKLKILGVLSEEKLDTGKTRTTINEDSIKFGFEIERRVYNGNEYNMVVINDVGKKYLLDNLESIMNAAPDE